MGHVDGDNGQLQNIGRIEGCEHTYSTADCQREECPWLAHSRAFPNDGTDPEDPPIWEDLGCIATLGTEGCGLEQQLESSLVALTARAAPGGSNEGFLRDHSLLVVVYIFDEDDCSAQNDDIFDPSIDRYGPMSVRCMLNPETLHPVERYRDTFIGLRNGDEDRVVVAAIVGAPVDGSWNPGEPLDDLRELQRVNPANPNERLPTCYTGRGLAYPPVRFVELVYAFGLNGFLGSICLEDWTRTFEDLARTVHQRLENGCAAPPSSLTPTADCRVVESLADDRPCPHLAAPPDSGAERSSGWHVDLGLDELGRRQCEVLVADGDGDGCPDGDCECTGCALGEVDCADQAEGCRHGWFLPSGSGSCHSGQVKLAGLEAGGSSQFRFECAAEPCPTARRAVELAGAGDSCDPNVPDSCADGLICVRNGRGICGEHVTCGRCSPTVGLRCPRVSGAPDWAREPLIGPHGCCHEGFHYDEETNGCEPDSDTGCLDDSCGCLSDDDCQDWIFCNGAEVCRDCECHHASPVDCDDGRECSIDECSEVLGACLNEPLDNDDDGYGDAECGGDDCDDEDPELNPGTSERCNGIDDDCDGLVDEPEEILVSLGQAARPVLSHYPHGYGMAWYEILDDEVALWSALLSEDGTPNTTARVGDGWEELTDRPAIVHGADNIALAWTSVREPGSEVLLLSFSTRGVPTFGPRAITDPETYASQPSMVWTGTELVVAFQEIMVENSFSRISLQRVAADGDLLGDVIPLTEYDRLPHSPSLVWTGSELGIAWVGPGAPMEAIFFARLSPAGELLDEIHRLDDHDGSCGAPVLLWTGAGYGAAWPELGMRIAYVSFSSDGSSVSPEVHFDDGGSAVQSLSMAWTGDEVGLLWSSSGSDAVGLSFARITAAGEMLDGPLPLSAGDVDASWPSLAWSGEEYAVAWEQRGEDTISRVVFGRLRIP